MHFVYTKNTFTATNHQTNTVHNPQGIFFHVFNTQKEFSIRIFHSESYTKKTSQTRLKRTHNSGGNKNKEQE